MISSSSSLEAIFLRMRNPSLLKQEFLKKWMMGLQLCTSSNKNTTLSDRKKAIRVSADIALASARNCATRWSRAVIASASPDDGSLTMADNVLGWTICERARRSCSNTRRVLCGRKILKRSRRVARIRRSLAPGRKPEADSIAKRLVKKRTEVLRGLVPGGEFMDEISLIEETLDYISALQAQVDVMRCVATAFVPSS